jgi:hypothetical protein
MLDSLTTATRTYGTHYMAEILELSPSEVYDRQEGYRNWTVRDAAALAIYCGLSLSDLS